MRNWECYLHKIIDDTISIKFLIFFVSSIFLLVDKITSDNWVNLAMALAGFHTANTVTSIVRGVPPIIPRKPLPRRQELDNPDGRL